MSLKAFLFGYLFLKFLIQLYIQLKHHVQLTFFMLSLSLESGDIVLIHLMFIDIVCLQLAKLKGNSFIFLLDVVQLFAQKDVFISDFAYIGLSFNQKLLQQLEIFHFSLQSLIFILQTLDLFPQIRNFKQILLNFVLMATIVLAFQLLHQAQNRIIHFMIKIQRTLRCQYIRLFFGNREIFFHFQDIRIDIGWYLLMLRWANIGFWGRNKAYSFSSLCIWLQLFTISLRSILFSIEFYAIALFFRV